MYSLSGQERCNSDEDSVWQRRWEVNRKHRNHSLSCPDGSDGKESTCNAGEVGLIPGLGRSPEEGHGYPLHYFFLENPHGQRSLAGYSPWGCNESDTTEQLSTAQHISHIMASTTFASGRHSVNISWMTGGMNTVLSENRVWYAYLK